MPENEEIQVSEKEIPETKPFLIRVAEIQKELKAPKNQRNNFGKYNYRSCEDILEAVKPLTTSRGIVLTISDGIIDIGTRFYVKATAKLTDAETGESLEAHGFAREPDTKKGMDESQITGASSSYARKYALNGLFCIDDSKDPDTDEFKNQQNNAPVQQNAPMCISCGKPFQDGGGRSAMQNMLMSASMNTDNQPRCSECMKKLGTFKKTERSNLS